MISNPSSFSDRTFIGKMITEGKKLYVLEKYLPTSNDYEKIGYSEEKYNWAIENEKQVWKYFIENKLLFSTDTELNQRFLELAPFSKFYRSEDSIVSRKNWCLDWLARLYDRICYIMMYLCSNY